MSEFCTGNCANCPAVIDEINYIEGMEIMNEAITRSAMDERVDMLAPDFLDFLKSNHGSQPELEEIESPQDLAVMLRQNAAAMSERIDEEAQERREDLKSRVMGCVGPITMRATKAGVEFTVSVCMKPPDQEADTMTESVTVKRRMASES